MHSLPCLIATHHWYQKEFAGFKAVERRSSSQNYEQHSSDSAGVRLPPTHKNKLTWGEILMCTVVPWFLSCQPAWLAVITENLNMLSWLPAGLMLGDLICDLWLKRMDQELMCLRTQWHGQISTPPEPDYPQCNTPRRQKPCGGCMNYMPPRASLGTRALFVQLMITVMWHQLRGNGPDLPAKLPAHPCRWCLLYGLITLCVWLDVQCGTIEKLQLLIPAWDFSWAALVKRTIRLSFLIACSLLAEK